MFCGSTGDHDWANEWLAQRKKMMGIIR